MSSTRQPQREPRVHWRSKKRRRAIRARAKAKAQKLASKSKPRKTPMSTPKTSNVATPKWKTPHKIKAPSPPKIKSETPQSKQVKRVTRSRSKTGRPKAGGAGTGSKTFESAIDLTDDASPEPVEPSKAESRQYPTRSKGSLGEERLGSDWESSEGAEPSSSSHSASVHDSTSEEEESPPICTPAKKAASFSNTPSKRRCSLESFVTDDGQRFDDSSSDGDPNVNDFDEDTDSEIFGGMYAGGGRQTNARRRPEVRRSALIFKLDGWLTRNPSHASTALMGNGCAKAPFTSTGEDS